MCLLATRGRPKRLARDIPQLIVAPRREHSRKPDEARTRIERLVCGLYVELFARERAPGWDAFGDELDFFDTPKFSTAMPTASALTRADPDRVKSTNRNSKQKRGLRL